MFSSGFVCVRACVLVWMSAFAIVIWTLQLNTMQVWLLCCSYIFIVSSPCSHPGNWFGEKIIGFGAVSGGTREEETGREAVRRKVRKIVQIRCTTTLHKAFNAIWVPQKYSLLRLTLVRLKYSINFDTLRTDESMIYTINPIAFCSIAWSILKVTW